MFAEQFERLKPGGNRDMRNRVHQNIKLVQKGLASGKVVFQRLGWNGWHHIITSASKQQVGLARPKGRSDVLHHTWLDILQFLKESAGKLKLVGCPEYQQAAMLVILYRKWIAEEDGNMMLVGTEDVPVVVEKVVESDADRAAREALEEEAFENQQSGETEPDTKMVIEIEFSDDEEW